MTADAASRPPVTAGAAGPPLTMLIVDDHTIVREGLKRVLVPAFPDWHIAEAANGHEALEFLRRQNVGLAIVDLSMPGMSGLELVRRSKAEFPRLRVLVLSMHSEEQYARRAFKAGAHGYVTKDTAATELVSAVRKVSQGGNYVSTTLAEQMVQHLNGGLREARLDVLSDRELGVLRRIVAGQRLTEIAGALHLSVKTVSTHKARIQEKLELPSMAALIRFGMEQGLDQEDIGPAALPRV